MFLNIVIIIIKMGKVSVSISIDSKLIYEIERMAEKEGKTRTEKIVELLRKGIEKK